MSQGPVIIFDKSSLQILTIDEAVMLDNFYRSNIVPIFFVECLADLEKQMIRLKGTAEQLVGSLAKKTPDCQSSANVYHLEILKGELTGQFDLNTVLLRPLLPRGRRIELGDSQGMIFEASREEEAVQRWSRHEFLNLEREIAKGWRRMISQIDLTAISHRVLDAIGPWRKPTSLQDARAMTDTIIDNLDAEWLLRLGLEILGLPEATEHVVNDWKSNRRKPIRDYRPYFIHMLSINIFFSLVFPTQLLKNVKQSHHIDLAYLYYLPFCTVFTSRDNFHVEVAPLFMLPAQQFVHGDELKEDLKRLHERYIQLPKEVLDQGLYVFAQFPPDDSSFLTTRLWDTYLPNWRKGSPNKVDVPPEIQAGLKDLLDKFRNKSVPSDKDLSIGELDFVELSRKVSPAKGSYLRFSRDVILKNREEEMRKRNEVFPAGTQFAKLLDFLTDLFKDPNISDIEVVFINVKLDEKGERLVEDNQHVAEIRAVAITGISDETREVLREQCEMALLISLLVLWTRPSSEKLGIMYLRPVAPGSSPPVEGDFEDWEKKAISAYVHRNDL